MHACMHACTCRTCPIPSFIGLPPLALQLCDSKALNGSMHMHQKAKGAYPKSLWKNYDINILPPSPPLLISQHFSIDLMLKV